MGGYVIPNCIIISKLVDEYYIGVCSIGKENGLKKIKIKTSVTKRLWKFDSSYSYHSYSIVILKHIIIPYHISIEGVLEWKRERI